MSERRLRRLFLDPPEVNNPSETMGEKMIPAEQTTATNSPDAELEHEKALLRAAQIFVSDIVIPLAQGETVYFDYDVNNASLLPQQMIANAIQASNPKKYITYSNVFSDYDVRPMLGTDRKPNGRVLVKRK